MADDGDDRMALLPEFVSSRELRAEFRVGQSTVIVWCEKGLPYYRIGRGRWFLLDEVREFIKKVLRRGKFAADPTFDA